LTNTIKVSEVLVVYYIAIFWRSKQSISIHEQ
jgi:hypothetical protein